MLKPAPTTKLAPGVARGVLEENRTETATAPAEIVVSFHNSDYRLHLRPAEPIATPVGKRIEGVIRADAKRVDVVQSGGRYVEPVHGRPRRVQGIVIDADQSARTITVNAGAPMICRLTDERQQAADFEPGAFVSFDVLRGATFEERPQSSSG